MSLLLPLGLLGLAGVLLLVLIYIIRPNYQTKQVSSTYVWKLSLKYLKKRIPTSRIRNILIFICQILILTAIALILAKPALVYETYTDATDVIAIIDSSASMYARSEGETRFQRAVGEVIQKAESVISEGGYISVIVADGSPYFLGERVTASNRSAIIDPLNAMLKDSTACSYGSSDIPAAMSLCEDVLARNPDAQIILYTDTEYLYIPSKVSVVTVRDAGEWNAAVLGARTEIDDGFYALTVQIACYGRDMEVELKVEVSGANANDASDSGRVITVSKKVSCDADTTKTVVFRSGGGTDTGDTVYYDLGALNKFSSYQTMHIYVEEADSFTEDNDYFIYGGQKEVIKVQYASADPNPFFVGALSVLHNHLAGIWDLQITEVKKGQTPAISGFDFYIFEHTVPTDLPTDGVILLADPDSAPVGAGFTIRRAEDFRGQSVSLIATDTEHPVMKNLIADYITLSRYTVVDVDSDYDVLMTCDSSPVLFVQKDGRSQLAVMSFSVHYSNVVILPEWYMLLYNLFDYFLPATVTRTSFEVNEQITVRGRGAEVRFSGEEKPITEFPASVTVKLPGTYTFEQETFFEKVVPPLNIFVKIPTAESNIHRTEDSLPDPYENADLTLKYDDLLIYLAAALVAILFLEWWLQSREGK